MLIDAGTNAGTSTLIKDIKALGITKFDVIVGTHPHEDHIGGMDAVINNFDIGTPDDCIGFTLVKQRLEYSIMWTVMCQCF
jgi:glyoxylase-like metal-dependent hydrolase (beta-lactamase superfamily II)